MHPFLIPSISVLLSFGMLATAGQAATFEVDLGPQTKLDLAFAQFRIWIPENVKAVRGMFVLTPGKNGDGRSGADNAEWQALATKHQFGIMAGHLRDDDTEAGYQLMPEVCDLLEKALKQGAADSKHPELDSVPLALWGHSAGANVSRTYAQFHAKRTLAIGLTKATAGGPNGGGDVPVLLTTGMKENPEWRSSNEKSWAQERKSGAPWALAVNPTEGHEQGKTLELIRPFLDECIITRLGAVNVAPAAFGAKPASAGLGKIKDAEGWLGNPKTLDISSYKTYKGSKSDACWFPGEESAKAWKAYLGTTAP